jgi:transglutaminase-like putative cysteine protease
MQSASPSGRLQFAGVAWDRTRESLGGGRAWSAVLVLLLTFAVARSTVTVHWVEGIEVITLIALAGAVVMGVLALLPIAEPISLLLGALLGPVAALIGAWPQLHANHPTDVLGLQLVRVWWDRIGDGSAGTDRSFYLVLICVLLWVVGGWLSWCVMRWGKPMLGLIPGAAAFATNLTNFPADQNGYVLSILVLILGLLLWTNYTESIAAAVRARVKLTGDARWDFWESGLVAMAALIVVSILLPALSTVDKTTDVQSGVFQSWAQLQQQLSHPGFFNGANGSSGVTGFSDDVKLSGQLQRTRDPVFIYNVVGDFAGPRYFRGVDATVTVNGEWRYPALNNGRQQNIQKNEVAPYADDASKLGVAGATVRMVRLPAGYGNVVFYPGEFYKVDRVTHAYQVPLPLGSNSQLYSVDRLDSIQPPTSAGTYTVTVEYSTATEAELRAAGTGYPDWVGQFMDLPPSGYRSPAVLQEVHQLAVDIVTKAGATTPYDAATAIERYLRDTTNFTYTLTPKSQAPAGADRLEWFLFHSHEGWCEYFATAMGDMLRSLNIPTRLVIGYGPGSFDPTVNGNVVHADDVHTWVEVYFPAYGWIPFEPTADGVYLTIPRGQTGPNACLRDSGCDGGTLPGTVGTVATPPSARPRNLDNPGTVVGPGGLQFRVPDAGTITKIVGIIVALLLLALVAASRYLRPRTVMAVWKRTLALASLAGAERRPGETPLELGRRLQRAFPEAAEPVGALASGFVVSAYAPPEVASTAKTSVMESWSALRPMLLRRVFARLRPSRPVN